MSRRLCVPIEPFLSISQRLFELAPNLHYEANLVLNFRVRIDTVPRLQIIRVPGVSQFLLCYHLSIALYNGGVNQYRSSCDTSW